LIVMEFRVFLPLLSEIDKGWLSASEFDAYSVAVANIKVGSAFAPEVRADSYFVGKPFFGLKYRHGTKLEIKVRDKNVVNGIEKWVKHKLGKKGIEKYKPEIMEILSSAGYDMTPACLEIEHQIAVEKSRHCVELEDLTLELCQLNILDAQPNYPGHIVRRKWLSFAVEGSTADIGAFLKRDDDPMNLRASLTVIHQILSSKSEAAVAHDAVPVVSGYPMFVHTLAKNVTPEEIQGELIGTWNLLIEQLAPISTA